VTLFPPDPTLSGAIAADRFLEQIDDPRLRQVYRYWDGLRGSRFAPAYAEVDPVDIPKLLSCLLVTAVESTPQGRRYRYRLCGTEVEQHFGSAMRGRYIDTLMQGPYLTYLQGLYDRLVEQRSAIYTVSTYHQQALDTKRLMLPLSSDGATVDTVLAAQVFLQSSGAPQTVLAVQADFEPGLEQSGGA
jgi:hypothetical protein